MNRKQLLYLIIPVLAATAFSGCRSNKERKAGTASEPVSVTTTTVKQEEIPAQVVFSGTVGSDHRVTLSTKMMGHVTAVPFDIGARVHKNDVVVRIQSDNLQAQKQQIEANRMEAEAALQNMKINYDRIKALYDENSATKKELDDITMQYKMARARIDAIDSKEKELDDMFKYAVLRAPMEGFVVQKNVEPGDMAAPGQPLVAIEDANDLQVTATVPQEQIGQFSVGDSVDIRIDVLDGKFLTGRILHINRAGDAMSGQFRIKIGFVGNPRAWSDVRSGMFAHVLWQAGDEQLLTIPKTALVDRGQLTGVYVVDDNGQAVLRWVRTGKSYGDRVEILAGLNPGDRLVTHYTGRLLDGQEVVSN
ncbi:MAG TPA: efflux RND transporter periplasmic adaptor subunit [Balneolales bacterium]|nr:efflux RND transporter periplasmic adaptor subunit [Balneolales bacterium]